MNLLYATGRYSPLKHDEGSGEDYNLHKAFIGNGFNVKIVGPLKDTPDLVERVYRRIHRLLSKERHAKYSLALLQKAAAEVARVSAEFKPDVLFSHNLSAFVRLNTLVPIVYLMDAPLMGTEAQWPLFSRVEYRRMLDWEKSVLNKAAKIITRSSWAMEYLTNEYGVPAEKIKLIQAASSLPDRIIPPDSDASNADLSTLHLLLVGRVYKLKGIDTAIEVVRLLNQAGYKTRLRIVGLNGENHDNVEFMGSYRKSVEAELRAYAEQYRWAHFLIHPARYDSAPIVTAEAAAFGVPTISNAVGGIATTVQHGVSGVVLPALSPEAEYVKAIRYYVDHPKQYLDLRRSTRERYERELNWKVVGDTIVSIIRQVVEEHKVDGTNKGA
jgi:glycosyltransferase involved in cell wall biosynthesis